MQIIFLSASLSLAQRTDYLYLKNGSIIKGEIIDTTENKIKIQTACQSIWAFDKSEVIKIEGTTKIRNKKIKEDYTGFNTYIAVATYFGSSYFGLRMATGATMTMGYHFKKNIYIGLGSGFEYFGFTTSPIFLDLKLYLNKKTYSPFCNLLLGYAFGYSENDFSTEKQYGGLCAGAELGIRNNFYRKTPFYYSFGYHLQKTKTVSTSDFWGG